MTIDERMNMWQYLQTIGCDLTAAGKGCEKIAPSFEAGFGALSYLPVSVGLVKCSFRNYWYN